MDLYQSRAEGWAILDPGPLPASSAVCFGYSADLFRMEVVMSKLWHCLSKENKRKLARYYEQQFGMKLIAPKRGEPAVQCETKIEDLEEIDRIMRKVPHPARRV